MIVSLTTMSKRLCNELAASTGACRLCGGETLLADPTRYVVDAQGFNDACAVHEYFAMLGPTEDWNYSCEGNRAMLSEKCCVGPPLSTFPHPCITVAEIGSTHAIMAATGIAIAHAVCNF